MAQFALDTQVVGNRLLLRIVNEAGAVSGGSFSAGLTFQVSGASYSGITLEGSGSLSSSVSQFGGRLVINMSGTKLVRSPRAAPSSPSPSTSAARPRSRRRGFR